MKNEPGKDFIDRGWRLFGSYILEKLCRKGYEVIAIKHKKPLVCKGDNVREITADLYERCFESGRKYEVGIIRGTCRKIRFFDKKEIANFISKHACVEALEISKGNLFLRMLMRVCMII